MFTFHKRALQYAKPQNAKTAVFSILTFVIFLILTSFTLMPLNNVLPMVLMTMMYQGLTFDAVLMIAICLIIPLVVFLFVGYQLAAGAIYLVYRAIHKEEVSFTDVFLPFKKGGYLKSVKLALFTLLFLAVLTIINYLLTQVIGIALRAIITSLQSSIGDNMGLLITIQIILITLVSLIISLVIWFFAYLVIAYTVAHLSNRSNGAFQDVKQSFKSLKNGRHSWFKLFLGLIILNLVVIIFGTPITQLVSLGTQHMSQNIAQIIAYVVLVIVYIVRIAVYFLNLMAIVAFFIAVNDHKATEQVKSKKSKIATKNNTTTKEHVEKESAKNNEVYTDNAFDHLSEKKKDIDERSDDFKK